MFRLWSSPEVCQYSGRLTDRHGNVIPSPVRNRGDSDKIVDFWTKAQEDGWGFRWALLRRASGEFVGTAGFNSLGPSSEYAYHLHPDHWHEGLMSEASAAAFAWLASEDFSTVIEAVIAPENANSIAFAERWGPININRFFKAIDGYPKIAQVLKEPEQTKNIGGGWHTDHSYDVAPAMCSILYALEVPDYGGDTLFAGMGAAYDALSDGFKTMLDSLRAVHSSSHVFGKEAMYLRDMGGRIGNSEAVTPDVTHPVIIRHPNTGRRLLYVNPGFTRSIDGWAQDESDQLLQFLYRHAMKPEFQARLKWQKGTLAMWDNRSTMHRRDPFDNAMRRVMHRTQIKGKWKPRAYVAAA
jgi:taurine dioxygenase